MSFLHPASPVLAGILTLAVFQWDSFPNLPSSVSVPTLNPRSTALAANPATYKPPTNRRRLQRTRGGGSRGCSLAPGAGSNQASTTLSLLVPEDHVAQTLSAHPIFVWYLSQPTADPMEFALVEPGVAKPLLVKQLQSTQSGIIRFELPPTAPGLVPGKEYRWTVSLICDANRPSRNTTAYAWIERVEPTASLTQQLATAKFGYDQASIYAQSGLWYDALATITSAYVQDPRDPQVLTYLSSLLHQIGVYPGTITSWHINSFAAN